MEIDKSLSKTQLILSNTWKEILGVEKIDMEKSFFDLGGSSMQAIKLIMAINNEYSEKFTIIELFKYPSINSFADFIDNRKTLNLGKGESLTHRKSNFKSSILNFTGGGLVNEKNKNIYFIPPVLGNSILFETLSKKLTHNFNCYGLQYWGLNENESFPISISEMSKDFTGKIIENKKDKEIILVGFSMGATIAFEMTKILEKRNIKVHLILIDKKVNRKKKGFYSKILMHREVDRIFKKYGELINNNFNKEIRIKKFIENNIQLMNNYEQSGCINSDIFFLGTKKGVINDGSINNWNNFTRGKLIIDYLEGDHWDALSIFNHSKIISLLKSFF